jgi:hypothetical protein
LAIPGLARKAQTASAIDDKHGTLTEWPLVGRRQEIHRTLPSMVLPSLISVIPKLARRVPTVGRETWISTVESGAAFTGSGGSRRRQTANLFTSWVQPFCGAEQRRRRIGANGTLIANGYYRNKKL